METSGQFYFLLALSAPLSRTNNPGVTTLFVSLDAVLLLPSHMSHVDWLVYFKYKQLQLQTVLHCLARLALCPKQFWCRHQISHLSTIYSLPSPISLSHCIVHRQNLIFSSRNFSSQGAELSFCHFKCIFPAQFHWSSLQFKLTFHKSPDTRSNKCTCNIMQAEQQKCFLIVTARIIWALLINIKWTMILGLL